MAVVDRCASRRGGVLVSAVVSLVEPLLCCKPSSCRGDSGGGGALLPLLLGTVMSSALVVGS